MLGFEVGADDYVTKPFSLRELVLRIRAVLRRRVQPPSAAERVSCGRVRVDAGAQRAWLDDRELALTALELRLLILLVTRHGRVHTREALLAEVWGLSPNVTTRTVDTHVLRLRAKLGPAAGQLQTLRGVGYRFAENIEVSLTRSDPRRSRRARAGAEGAMGAPRLTGETAAAGRSAAARRCRRAADLAPADPRSAVSE
ncbi:winged helix-turn-helix domain-containing protein [Nannocystis pusilla]|uniref:winged helix-turn-helix domain-containing protein n=1 Tax=Nannocystis pusilla TaxID=889268 RepID=UPI003B7AD458